MPANQLFYGDNLDVLRKHIRDESVDLCYIDPPFNSKRTYNQIYNNIGIEDAAQAQAFIDTWLWNDQAAAGLDEILANEQGRFQPQTVELIKGLHAVLGKGSLLAYLISITLRVTEIQRILKPTGSFYLHCDPTASHYLKLVLDGVFCSRGGEYVNEITWCYELGGRISRKAFGRRHDVLLFYTKSEDYNFYWDDVLEPWSDEGVAKFRHEDEKGRYRLIGRFIKGSPIKGHRDISPEWEKTNPELVQRYYLKPGKMQVDFWNISPINQVAKERLGYPTQKPEALLERVISASSKEGDLVLDAYCGCGTTVAVAERLNRRWIGVDITYQSISLIMKRLSDTYGAQVENEISLNGIPRDMASARALAHKKDDRLRKEFEKWAILTYATNRAIINDKKGADGGIDGVAYFKTGKTDNAKLIFQAKSGAVKRSDIATLRGDMEKSAAAMACLITLEEPSKPMIAEAREAGKYLHAEMGRSYDKISIVTVREIVEDGKRLDIPMSVEVLKAAQRNLNEEQLRLL
ncbi:DNA methyltransferase [Granulicella arctica]|uniref:Site-specific DNA-methyltransferase (Adenine-specific) n=1 Tax=Granulicella arctica TaxID=940613 RepID=A0A7Y9PI55_9BACT|nr:DNA methyltransferase [Granulicella arctica]NYF80252.1 site-specific DNA-methyltransferase (adenine-specific) [Granulicella arctica]